MFGGLCMNKVSNMLVETKMGEDTNTYTYAYILVCVDIHVHQQSKSIMRFFKAVEKKNMQMK